MKSIAEYVALIILVAALCPGCSEKAEKTNDNAAITDKQLDMLKERSRVQDRATTQKPPVPTVQSEVAQPKPFNREIYRSIDDSQIITMISKDELEWQTSGTTLVCKYSKQEDTLRVVAQTFGTTQALYYRVTDEGLRDKDGAVLYNPAKYAATKQALIADRQRKLDDAKATMAQLVDEARTLLVGTWRDENSLSTYNADGTSTAKYHNGETAKCKWSIDGDTLTVTLVERDGKALQTAITYQNTILDITTSTFVSKSLINQKVWHATKVK